jgi:hypothetical protein
MRKHPRTARSEQDDWTNSYPPSHRVRTLVTTLIAVLVVVALIVIVRLSPIDPYHQRALHALRTELTQLPPYQGSVAAQTLIKASPLDLVTRIEVIYSSLPSQCAAIQAYYASQAQQVGWTMDGSVRTLHRDSNPDHNELDGRYLKAAQGNTLGLEIACFASQTFQGGYTLDLTEPPD